ncbi:MAG TPA: hypothetical protein VG125_22040 [Pirellulales bacterium]|jgi:hypothetical protein|nr:hypothetical protein [Pirellulales bacterium]
MGKRGPQPLDGSNEDLAAYVPTPVEIAEGCRRIQAHWSSTERRMRAGKPRFDERMGVTEIAWLGTLDGDGT